LDDALQRGGKFLIARQKATSARIGGCRFIAIDQTRNPTPACAVVSLTPPELCRV
jgi:hypothetical protein